MWQSLIYTSTSVVVTIVTGAVVLFLVSPKHIIYWYIRLDAYRCGMKVKYVGDENFIYCYGERGRPNPNKTSILMIHGFTSTKDMFLALFKRLPSDLHLIAVDLPGHGGTSGVKEIDKLGVDFIINHIHNFTKLVGLDKKPFHVLGSSLGGALAGLYAVEHPESVDRLTMICPAMKTPQHSPFTEATETAILNGIDNVQLKDCSLLPLTAEEGQKMLDAILYHKTTMHKHVLKGLIDLRKPKNPFFLELFKALAREESTTLLERRAKNIKVPTQLVWGRHDEIIDCSGAEVLKKEIPTIQQVDIFERCGHSVQLDRPGCLLKALLTFRGEYKK